MLCMGWRNLFLIPVVLLCQFLFWREIGCGFTCYLCTQEYNKVVVLCLVFLVLAGNSFWCFVHMVLILQYSCAVVSVFGSGGKSVLVLHTSPPTTSQKRRMKHLGVCRSLKVLLAIFTNRSIKQQQKTATQHIHNTQQQPK